MSIVLNGTTGITTPDVTSDSYTGALAVDASAPDDSLVVDASGNLLVGDTSYRLSGITSAGRAIQLGSRTFIGQDAGGDTVLGGLTGSNFTAIYQGGTERARIDPNGHLLVGKTSSGLSVAGFEARGNNEIYVVRSGGTPCNINRLTDDGQLINFYQAGISEGTISVSGSTVSYNGGHLARWAQTLTAKDESLVKGTVLSNLDDMNVYVDADGNPVDNEQLNKVKVSDVEGDANVAGVFVNWDYDEAHNVDEINMAMTGDMIIRIAAGTTVARGDLLMSAGDGTAKPQGDDIVRSKTIAKVISTNVTCTYEDGSFCVPCVLMAC